MKVIQFTKARYVAFIFSLIIVVCGLVYAFTVGPNWGIDFRHGLNMVVSVKDYNADTQSFEPVPAKDDQGTMLIQEIRDWFKTLSNPPKIQLQSDAFARYAVRSVFTSEQTASAQEGKNADEQFDYATTVRDELVKSIEATGIKVVSAALYDQGLVSDYQGRLVVIESSQSSSPAWTSNSWKQLGTLLLIVLLLITLYIWIRFTWGFAVAASVALLHDMLIMISFVCFLPYEVSKTTIAALLTIMGYSLNDTIVVFDRIRENKKLMADQPIRTIINTSITQSLSRTMVTSLTTFLAVIALFIFTEGDIKSFAANMMVGIVFGTYSSIFLASPIYLECFRLNEFIKKRRQSKKLGYSKRAVEASPVPKGVSLNENGDVEIDLIERKKRRPKRK